VTLESRDRHARCGNNDRTYTRRYDDRFTETDGNLILELEAVDTPCLPNCSLKQRYRLRRLNLEP